MADLTGRARILVTEDDPDLIVFMRRVLEQAGHDVDVASSGAEALAKAAASRADLVLLDVALPDMSGIDVAKCLRADVATSTTMIVFVTGRTDERRNAFDWGADDFVTKPFDVDDLVIRVRAALRRSRSLRAVSPLTGLPGNLEVLHQLEVAIAQPDQHFALIWADLDNFKAYNDFYGFLRGDRALAATAEVLVAHVEALDSRPRFVGHVGGDDFALLMAETVAEEVAKQLAEGFDDLVPGLYDAADLARGYIEVASRRGSLERYPLLTLSMGIATSAHRHYSLAQDVVAVANESRRWAKSQPRSAWRSDQRSRSGLAGQLTQ